ncbi:MAG: type II toxin-antitoxin system VapC family toxin [Vicinamibacteria bacterium]
MTAVVVDSSVAVKWFVPEALSEPAARLLDPSYELWAPDLLIPEFGNVLWKKLRRGEIRRDEALEIVAALREVPLEIAGSADLVAPALDIAAAYGRTVYDALYVALAVARDCVLVTADERLAAALTGGPLARHVSALSSMA